MRSTVEVLFVGRLWEGRSKIDMIPGRPRKISRRRLKASRLETQPIVVC